MDGINSLTGTYLSTISKYFDSMHKLIKRNTIAQNTIHLSISSIDQSLFQSP